ncbi:MAG: cobalamin-dependent protein [Candidatus Bathyarchaeia archaeon]|nr:cobalamin-dependent protein [Candidatus Bathyarchaeota archaeon]
MIEQFEDSIVNLDSDRALNLCEELLKSGVSVDDIFGAIGKAMDIVGDKYESNEYFLSELIMAGEVVKEVLSKLEQTATAAGEGGVATVVLATVRGDLHDIGKNIVGMLLRSSGFRVVDLGVDVEATRILEAIKENKADILGLSALLSTTVNEFSTVVEELVKAGLRGKVKVIVGGAAVNEEVARKSNVDAWGKTAVEGLKICRQWAGRGGD